MGKYIINEKDRMYINKITNEFNMCLSNVYALKRKWKFDSFERVYYECVYRKNLKQVLQEKLVDKKPSILKGMFDTDNKSACSISFVRYVFMELPKGVIKDSTKERYIEALNYLNELEDKELESNKD